MSTPDLGDEECSLVTGSRCWITIVTVDREHPRMYTMNELFIFTSWRRLLTIVTWIVSGPEMTRLTFLARDTLDPDRDGFVPAVMLHITIVMMGRDKSN